MSDLPFVSVIITTYKRSSMLKRAINSVLEQTYPNIEVVIVDDNNPGTEYRKDTEKVVWKYKNFNEVKYIKHPKNLNGATARNTGIKNCSGEFIAFLDDDDWYLENKIEKQVKYLFDNPEYDAVYCGWERNNKDWLYSKEGDLTFEVLCGTNPVITNTILMRKDAAIKCGGWDERFKRNQEPAFLLRFFKHGYKIGVVKEILVKFDISDRSNAFDAQKNEDNINFFMKVHKDQINEYSHKIPGAKKLIYSNRYKSVFLNYIKHKDFKNAIRIYLKFVRRIPLRFNIDLLLYFIKRNLGR